MKLMYELAIKLIDIYILISSLFNKKLKEFMKEEKIPLNTLMKILIFKKKIYLSMYRLLVSLSKQNQLLMDLDH